MLRDISVESIDAAIGAGSDARGAAGDELRDVAPPVCSRFWRRSWN